PSVERSPELLQLRRDDPAAFVDQLLERARTQGARMFGFKVFYEQALMNPAAFAYLLANRDMKVIHLVRRNLLQRRLSELRAQATDRWIHAKGSSDASGAPSPVLDVEAPRLIADFQRMTQRRREFAEIFAEHDVLEVFYEDLVTDLSATYARICDFLGIHRIPVAPRTDPTPSRPLSELVPEWNRLRVALQGTGFETFFTD